MLVLYWIENGIIGAINVAKIARAEGELAVRGATFQLNGRATGSRTAMIGFFLMHYGIFWAVHGIFVFLLPVFVGLGSMTSQVADPFTPTIGPGGRVEAGGLFPSGEDPGLRWDLIALGAIGLTISHGASYVLNFIGRREYRHISPVAQTMAPYGRVFVLHITIIVGAIFSGFLGSPVAAVAVLVVANTLLDLVLHLAEHRHAEGRAVLTA